MMKGKVAARDMLISIDKMTATVWADILLCLEPLYPSEDDIEPLYPSEDDIIVVNSGPGTFQLEWHQWQ